MSAKKTAVKTAVKPSAKRPQPHGGALNAGGTPGNRGGGRPKDEFKALMRQLVSCAPTETQLKTILSDAAHPHFMRALDFATAHGYGRPTETVEMGDSFASLVLQAFNRQKPPE